MDYSLRDCTLQDIDFIVKLKELGLRWYVEKLYGWDYQKQKEIALKELKEYFDTTKIIVAEGKDVGVTTLIDTPSHYEVWLIAIHPDYQGNGIASRVINSYIERARAEKKRIIIKTFKQNPALNLYKKLGFVEYNSSDTHVYLDINF